MTAEIPPLEISSFIGHNKVTTTLTVYAHLINTDDHTRNIAALGAMASGPTPSYSGNFVPLHVRSVSVSVPTESLSSSQDFVGELPKQRQVGVLRVLGDALLERRRAVV